MKLRMLVGSSAGKEIELKEAADVARCIEAGTHEVTRLANGTELPAGWRDLTGRKLVALATAASEVLGTKKTAFSQSEAIAAIQAANLKSASMRPPMGARPLRASHDADADADAGETETEAA